MRLINCWPKMRVGYGYPIGKGKWGRDEAWHQLLKCVRYQRGNGGYALHTFHSGQQITSLMTTVANLSPNDW